jgi:hypothetical protein
VFLSKDFLETEHCFHVSTSAYVLFLDVNKKYIPDVTLSFGGGGGGGVFRQSRINKVYIPVPPTS